jgi:hypothetical protein
VQFISNREQRKVKDDHTFFLLSLELAPFPSAKQPECLPT